MQGLTRRQEQILQFITQRIEEQGYPPTIREIGEEMGIRSTNGVNDHLKALERKGALVRDGLKSRALRPVDVETSSPIRGEVTSAVIPGQGDTVGVPVLGRVAAGAPILADENPEATVYVDRFFVGPTRDDQLYALRVSGDSMIEAGIHDGDYIFVRKQLQARRGDIVVAMIDGEATVKRYEPDGDVIRFVPENASMEPIVVRKSDFRATSLLGIVVGVYRKMF
ncbi:MAG: transcriptional repressor LexA [Myxococcota bacterium]